MNKYLEQLEKKADVARDSVMPALYNIDEQRRPYAHVSPEMAQALETAAFSGGTYLAAHGLGKVNPGIAGAAPYLAGAAGLASLTNYGKKVDANLRNATNINAAMMRNQARAEHQKAAEEAPEHNWKPAIGAGLADAAMGVGFGALGHQISKRFLKGKYAPGIIGGLEGAAAMGVTDMYQRKHEAEIRDLKAGKSLDKQASFLAAAGLLGLRKATGALFGRTSLGSKSLGTHFAAGLSGGTPKRLPGTDILTHGLLPGIGKAQSQAGSVGQTVSQQLRKRGYGGSMDDVLVNGGVNPNMPRKYQKIVNRGLTQANPGRQVTLPKTPVQQATSKPNIGLAKAVTAPLDLAAGSYFSGATNAVEAIGRGATSLGKRINGASNRFLDRIHGHGAKVNSFGHKMDHAEGKVVAGEGTFAAANSIGHFF